MDTSGDGVLSKEELVHGYQKFYGADFNEKEVEALFEMAD
jgi:Ca2+-binding EF-hand superfamily protein